MIAVLFVRTLSAYSLVARPSPAFCRAWREPGKQNLYLHIILNTASQWENVCTSLWFTLHTKLTTLDCMCCQTWQAFSVTCSLICSFITHCNGNCISVNSVTACLYMFASCNEWPRVVARLLRAIINPLSTQKACSCVLLISARDMNNEAKLYSWHIKGVSMSIQNCTTMKNILGTGWCETHEINKVTWFRAAM